MESQAWSTGILPVSAATEWHTLISPPFKAGRSIAESLMAKASQREPAAKTEPSDLEEK